jgi:hypothetical protein
MEYQENLNAVVDLSECGQCLLAILKISYLKLFFSKAIRKDLPRKLLQDMKYHPHILHIYIYKTPWPESACELYRLSDRRLLVKLVPTSADKGCRMVSATDPFRHHSRFSRPEPLLFFPSSFSIVLTRLSGPHSRPSTSQRIW